MLQKLLEISGKNMGYFFADQKKEHVGEEPEKYSFGSQKHVVWDKWIIHLFQQNGLQTDTHIYGGKN